MKKVLCLLSFFILAMTVKSQSNQKRFELKNGSIIKGVVIEEVPGVSYTVKTQNGNLFVFEASEIEKITLNESVEEEKSDGMEETVKEEEKLKEGISYYNMNEIVLGGAGMDGGFNMVMGLGSINGIQINSFQLGVGIEYIFSPGDVDLNFIPIYLDMRYLFSNTRRSFFVLADIGYTNADGYEYENVYNGSSSASATVSYDGGFFFRIGGGYNFPISNKIDANINMTYMVYGYDVRVGVSSSASYGGSSSYTSSSQSFSGTDGMLAIKFGIGFGK